jgi:hypothetical protein
VLPCDQALLCPSLNKPPSLLWSILLGSLMLRSTSPFAYNQDTSCRLPLGMLKAGPLLFYTGGYLVRFPVAGPYTNHLLTCHISGGLLVHHRTSAALLNVELDLASVKVMILTVR